MCVCVLACMRVCVCAFVGAIPLNIAMCECVCRSNDRKPDVDVHRYSCIYLNPYLYLSIYLRSDSSIYLLTYAYVCISLRTITIIRIGFTPINQPPNSLTAVCPAAAQIRHGTRHQN